MTGYELSRDWFNFRFENPSKVRAVHSEFYLYLVDQWNRLGQKKEIGLPTRFTMESLAIGSYNTYKNTLADLVEWGFVRIIKDSHNQHSSKVIALSKNDVATDKALDKATIKASDEPTDKATDTIIEQGNKGIIQNKEQIHTTPEIPSLAIFLSYYQTEISKDFPNREFAVQAKYESWVDAGWKNGYGKKIKNWKAALKNTILHLPEKKFSGGGAQNFQTKKPESAYDHNQRKLEDIERRRNELYNGTSQTIDTDYRDA